MAPYATVIVDKLVSRRPSLSGGLDQLGQRPHRDMQRGGVFAGLAGRGQRLLVTAEAVVEDGGRPVRAGYRDSLPCQPAAAGPPARLPATSADVASSSCATSSGRPPRVSSGSPASTRARASPSRTPNTIPARSANRHPVQPLGVIDQAQHRPARRRVGQQRQDRQPDQEAVRRRPLHQSERRPQRPPLRSGQPVHPAQERRRKTMIAQLPPDTAAAPPGASGRRPEDRGRVRPAAGDVFTFGFDLRECGHIRGPPTD